MAKKSPDEITVTAEEIAVKMPERTLEIIGSELSEHAAQLVYHMRGSIYEGIECGRRLAEARPKAKHGEWMNFVRTYTPFSYDIANRLLKIYEGYGEKQTSLFGTALNSETFQNLNLSQAFELLAIPEGERETFAQEVDAESLSVRELKKKIAEREAELAEAEKARDEAQTQIYSVEDKLKSVEYQLQMSRESGMELGAENKTLKAELDALKSAPVEAVVKPDEAAITEAVEKVRAETEASAAAKIAQMQSRLDEAGAAVKSAEENALNLRKELNALRKNMPDNQVMEESIRKATEQATAEVQAKLDKARADKKKADQKRKEAERALENAKAQAEKELADLKAKAEKELADLKKKSEADRKAANERLQAAQEETRKISLTSDSDIATFNVFFTQTNEIVKKMHDLLLKVRDGGNEELAAKLSAAMNALADAVRRCAE